MTGRRKGLPALLFLLGCCLVIAASALLGARHLRYRQWERSAALAAQTLGELLPRRTKGDPEARAGSPMPVMELGGSDYIGLLEAPEYGVSLALLADWADRRPEMLPARFRGSVYEGSLIVGAPPLRRLDLLGTMDLGTVFTVTDLYGSVFSFRVARVRHFDGVDTPLLSAAEGDLILFAKGEGRQYLVVSCLAA